MTQAHSPGPWFADEDDRIWRRPLSDLYERGGTVAGDKPIAVVDKGWYRENEVGFPVEANARLIAAAPDLLEATKRLIGALGVMVTDKDSDGDIIFARAAIAKATGEAT